MDQPQRLITTSFVISGDDFDPDEATRTIGLKPTEVWFQKDRYLLLEKDFPKLEWSVGCDKRNFDEIDDAVQEVLEVVWPFRERIRAYVQENGLRISFVCAVFIYADPPLYNLYTNSLERMAWFGAHQFSLVIYDYREEGDR